jgi:HEAT repeat protein
MRLWLALLLTVMIAAGSLAADNSGGFVSLFSGKSLDGWVVAGNPEGFRVVDGCIHSDGGKGGDWIRTEKQYGNFVLRIEWMLSKTGNSGIFIRNGPFGGGFEVQLLAPWTPYRDDLHCTCSLYGHVPANPRPDETTLRWRKAEVTAAYKHITVSVDGAKCCEADYDQVPSMKDLALAGYVGMQDSHTGEGESVRFRNIEIRDLDQDPAFVSSGLEQADPAVRRVAFDAAVRLGAPMVGPLLDMIARGDAPQRHIAEMALARIVANASAPGAAGQAAAVRTLLLARLESARANDAAGRVWAARLLGIIGQADRRTVDALKRALLSGGSVSAAALETMQRIPGWQMTEALIGALHQVEPSQQPAMLLALGARKDERTLSTLNDAARSRSEDVQTAAVRALGLLGSAKAIPVLRRIGAGAPDRLRQAVVDALIAILDAKGQDERARVEALQAARELAVTDAQKRALGLSR